MLSWIFGGSNYGMLIRRPLAAQLSYLLIYWSSALLGLRGQAGRILGLTVTGLWPLHPGEHFSHSSALFLDSDVHFQVQVSILRLPVPKLEKFSPKVPPRLDFTTFWASICNRFL